MAGKKAVKLSKLTFNELKDKAKSVEGFKAMNRFELLGAVLKAENRPEPQAPNPRSVKPEIKTLDAKLETAEDKKARRELRRAKARLKRETRRYL
ncbi:MAG: hypothetical protein LBV21_00170 [Candidatus Adiutrix sp.]|jgi:hypothetical protein|nr:hypothetical protein [Candidatus Adiutrix sp.]